MRRPLLFLVVGVALFASAATTAVLMASMARPSSGEVKAHASCLEKRGALERLQKKAQDALNRYEALLLVGKPKEAEAMAEEAKQLLTEAVSAKVEEADAFANLAEAIYEGAQKARVIAERQLVATGTAVIMVVLSVISLSLAWRYRHR